MFMAIIFLAATLLECRGFRFVKSLPSSFLILQDFQSQSKVREALEGIRANSGNSYFLREKWREMALDGYEKMKKVDSTVTGSSSYFFDGLSHFFAALDYLAVFFSTDKSVCFSQVDFSDLFDQEDVKIKEWGQSLQMLKRKKIIVIFKNETFKIPLSMIWDVVKHRGICVTKAETPDILEIGAVKVNKSEILEYMSEGIRAIELAPVVA